MIYAMSLTKETFKPQATLGICNTLSLGIAIVHEDGDDYVYSMYLGDESKKKLSKSRVMWNTYGHAYFRRDHQRFYINDFCRVNMGGKH